MSIIILLLGFIHVVFSKEIYICSGVKPDLCIGVRKDAQIDDKLNLRSMSSTLPRNDTRKFLGWEVGNGTEVIQLRNETLFIGAFNKYTVLKKSGIHFKLPFLEEKLTEYFGGIYAKQSGRCLTILKCKRKLSENGNPYCIDEETNPVQEVEEIVKGAFIQLRSCQEPIFTELDEKNGTVFQSNDNSISQYFSIKYQCSPGCEFEFLGNGICDEECDTKTCAYDYGECTKSPTITPTTQSPTTKEPTQYPTKKGGSLSPSSNPSFVTTNLPTSNPVIPPTMITLTPTFAPSLKITTPTNDPTYSPTKKPSNIPTYFPTQNMTNFPTSGFTFTFPPTKDYMEFIVSLIQLSSIIEDEVLGISRKFDLFVLKTDKFVKDTSEFQKKLVEQANVLTNSMQESLNTIWKLESAILAFVIPIFCLLAFFLFIFYVLDLRIKSMMSTQERTIRMLTNMQEEVAILKNALHHQVQVRISGEQANTAIPLLSPRT